MSRHGFEQDAGSPGMEFDGYGLLLAFHVLFASLWFGAGVYQVAVIGRGLTAAGPAAGGFVSALMRSGGIGRFFAISGALTIVFGGVLYGQGMDKQFPSGFEGRGLWILVGAIVALAAFVHGLTANMPTERKLIALVKSLKGPPTQDQAQQMQALGMKLGKAGRVGVAMVGTAMVLMLLSRVFV
jgi:hypothetical protein